MFTGLVEEIGTIKQLTPNDGSLDIEIESRLVLSDIALGDSISVNGTCLTAIAITENSFSATATPETLTLTNLSDLQVGDPVNLERSITMQTRLGGHMVQGHVDGTAIVKSVRPEGESQRWEFETAHDLLNFMVHKGSIAVNGVSLTVAGLTQHTFSVALIPKTIELTTFQFLKPGDRVNIEADMIGKYIHKYLAQLTTKS